MSRDDQTAFRVHFQLVNVPSVSIEWLRTQFFETAIARQRRIAARIASRGEGSAVQREAYQAGVEAVLEALAYARDTLQVTPAGAEAVTLSIDFRYVGNMAISEDGRRLWLRQSFEDLVLSPFRANLLERSYCVLLCDVPPAASDEELLKRFNDAFDYALATANDFDSRSFYIAGEAA